jgi:serine/threonine-protein kinase RIO1
LKSVFVRTLAYTVNPGDEETVIPYEELISVRSRLKRFGINAVDFNEIRSYLGSRPAYSVVRNHDPRELYDFYIDRKEMSLLRKRLNAPGPYKTLEEIYIEYRMSF